MYDINHAYAPAKFTWNLKMMVSKAGVGISVSFSGEPSEVLGIVCLSSYVVTVVFISRCKWLLFNKLSNYIWQMIFLVTCAEDLKEDAEHERNWTNTLPETNSSPLKMYGFQFRNLQISRGPLFSGANC